MDVGLLKEDVFNKNLFLKKLYRDREDITVRLRGNHRNDGSHYLSFLIYMHI
jgi:hypothetical protein